MQYTAGDGEDYTVRVKSLTLDGYFKEGVSFIPPWDGEVEVSTLAIQPIPLTPEILEKNGFSWDGSGQRSMMLITPFGREDKDALRYNIYVGLKYRTIEVFAAHPQERKPGWRKSNKAFLEVCGPYVHELQHALRLCGIDKEIVI